MYGKSYSIPARAGVSEFYSVRDAHGNPATITVHFAKQSSGYKTDFMPIPNWYITIKNAEGKTIHFSRTTSEKRVNGYRKHWATLPKA
jgi:hypothetical protein